MATMKFNIGDLVRRINHNNGDGATTFKKGQVGKVHYIDCDGFIDVEVNGEVNHGNDPANLKLVEKASPKFKVGDHVVIEESNVDDLFDESHAGQTGVVKAYKDTWSGHNYLINVDNRHALSIWCKVKCLVEDKKEEKIVITHDGKTTTATMYSEDGSKVTATAKCAPEDKFDFNVGAKLAVERLMEKVDKPTPVTVNGFKIGDRVNCNGVNGTIICFAKNGEANVGVEFDDCEEFKTAFGWGHRCGVISLMAGKEADSGHKATCRWRKADQITRGEVVKPKYYNGKVVCINDDLDWWTKGKIYTVVDGTIIDDDGDVRYKNHRIVDIAFGQFAKMFLPIVEDENKLLTTEEIKKMDGKKVYAIRLDENGRETPEHSFSGWHTVNVKDNWLTDSKGMHWDIGSNNEAHGYHAYRTKPTTTK